MARLIYKILLLLTALAASTVRANSTYDFTYTGRLTGSDGKPYEGPVALSVAFYHQAAGGSAVAAFTNGLEAVTLQEGIFQVKLAIASSDYAAIFADVTQPTYVEVTDLTHAPNSPFPRQQISIVPYAGRIPVDGKTVGFDGDGKLAVMPYSAPGAGQFLTKDGAGNFTWATPSSSATSLQGQAVSSAVTPTAGQVLKYDGTQWVAGTITAGTTAIGSAITSAAPGSLLFADGSGNLAQDNAKLFWNDTSDSLGIGTTSPGSTLDINGTTTSRGSLFVGTNGDFKFLADIFTIQRGSGNKIVFGQDGVAPAFDLDSVGAFATSDLFSLKNAGTPVFKVDHAGKVGIGTTAPSSALQVAGAIATALASKSSAYSLTASDSVVTADATSAPFAVTLPTAASIMGRRYTIKKIDNSANAVTITPFGVETIDGASTYTLSAANDAVSVISDGASWIVDARTAAIGSSTSLSTTGTGTFSQITSHGSTADIATNSAGTSLTFGNAGVSTIVASNASGSLGLGVNGATSALQIKTGNTKTTLSIDADKVAIGTTATPGSMLEIRGSGSTSATSSLNVTNSAGVSNLFVSDNGNVGIGTTNPLSKLEVVGANSDGTIAKFYRGGSEKALYIQSLSNADSWISSEGNVRLRTNVTPDSPYSTGVDVMFLKTDGKVGIGTTAPIYPLDVNGVLRTQSRLVINDTDFGSSSLKTLIGGLNGAFIPAAYRQTDGGVDAKIWDTWITTNTFQMRAVNDAYSHGTPWVTVVRNGDSIDSVVFPNGKVGIGTTSPLVSLEVASPGASGAESQLILNNPYTGTYASDYLKFNTQGTTVAQIIGQRNSGTTGGWLIFSTTDSSGSTAPERMRITDTGNVGIGTSDPAFNLDVAGSIHSQGLLIERKVTFTPTTIGWYRIYGAATELGGVVRIANAGYDNTYTDVEFQFNIAGYGNGGSIQETRYASYNGGAVSKARISSDGGNTVFLDIYVSTATVPAPIDIYAFGPFSSNFIPAPVVGAVAGPSDAQVLTFGHGFRTTASVAADGTGDNYFIGKVGIGTTSPGARLDVVDGTGEATFSSSGMTLSGFAPTLSLASISTGSPHVRLGGSGSFDGHNYNVLSTGSAGMTGLPAGYFSIYDETSTANRVVVDTSGNVGIGTTAPKATLDIQGYARLATNSSAPVTCDASHSGAISLTHLFVMCVCNGSAWVTSSDGTTSCSW